MDPMLAKEQHQDDRYGNSQWMEGNDYHSPYTQSPAHEYNAFGFTMGSSHEVSHEMPMENRSIPPLYITHQPQQSLIAAQWPKMIINPSTSNPPPPMATPSPLAPVSSFAATHSLPPLTTPTPTPSARRKLTDQDRRRMCQYHDGNPTVKQTEIGAMFGVERSTVSKVLRNKDKYLFLDDGSRSPVKRSKGKFPDLEKALSNWARNHQRQGLPLSDCIIRDKARLFATTVGNSESHLKISDSWLEKFKRKHHLLGAKSRKPSDANDSDTGFTGDSLSGPQTPNGISPISPSGYASPSPLSPRGSRDSVETKSPDSYTDFSYRHFHSHPAPTSSSPNTSTLSSPVSPPSQDEARRAMELVMNFFQKQPTGLVDSQEFIIMGKLMEKLRVQRNMGELPGGMHSMLVGSKEMSRKRSTYSL
ncbi:hypothetical protein MMC15_003060 [Xylographa vitiligo]|nr:hypothetical protein [Xylographa vitiligo]